MFQRLARFLEVREDEDEEEPSRRGHGDAVSDAPQASESQSDARAHNLEAGNGPDIDTEEALLAELESELADQAPQPPVEHHQTASLTPASARVSDPAVNPISAIPKRSEEDFSVEDMEEENLSEVPLESPRDSEKGTLHPQEQQPGLASNNASQSKSRMGPDLDSFYILRLDDALAAKLETADPKSADLDGEVMEWLRSGEVETVKTSTAEPPNLVPTPRSEHTQYPKVAPTGSEHQAKELEALRREVESLSQQLDRAETARIELASLLTSERIAAETKITELENKVADLERSNTILEMKSLSVEALSHRRTNSDGDDPFTDINSLLKHCSRLAQRLDGQTGPESVREAALSRHDVQQSLESGRIIASLSSKLVASEQQVKDEKLVLKNMLISWLERGERRDAFEILAGAFDFTGEDRARLQSKTSWARSAAGAKWSFGESLADFVRDEVS